MDSGVERTWDIGSIRMDVVELPRYQHVTLGIRQFVDSRFDEYYFSLVNGTSDVVKLRDLEYSMPEGVLVHTLKASAPSTSKDRETDQSLLMVNESRMFRYSLEFTEYGQCYFFIFKPFLRYEVGTRIYTMPLDYAIYSSDFDDEVIDFIKENHCVVRS